MMASRSNESPVAAVQAAVAIVATRSTLPAGTMISSHACTCAYHAAPFRLHRGGDHCLLAEEVVIKGS